jgi:hypothetical protein
VKERVWSKLSQLRISNSVVYKNCFYVVSWQSGVKVFGVKILDWYNDYTRDNIGRQAYFGMGLESCNENMSI